MHRKRTAALAAGFVISLAAPTAAADAWTCAQDGLVREVTVFYPNAPAPLPCEVFYTKRHENGLPRALWSASNEAGYCARKAEAFVARLRGLGWQCEATVPPAD